MITKWWCYVFYAVMNHKIHMTQQLRHIFCIEIQMPAQQQQFMRMFFEKIKEMKKRKSLHKSRWLAANDIQKYFIETWRVENQRQ